jgi:hypothetical protein
LHRILFRRITQSFLGIGVTNGYLKGFVPPGTLWQGQSRGFCVPALNCYACPGSLFACPIGTLQHFVIIRAVPMYFLGFFVTFCIAIGRMACGTICPFGYLQEILYKFRSTKLRIPAWMTYIKYAMLAGLVFVIPYYTLQPWFSKLCPVGTLIGGLPWVTVNPEIRLMIHELLWVKIALLITVVSFSALSKRPFCRVICAPTATSARGSAPWISRCTRTPTTTTAFAAWTAASARRSRWWWAPENGRNLSWILPGILAWSRSRTPAPAEPSNAGCINLRK